MGDSIRLDPCDVHHLTAALSLPFGALLENGTVSLVPADGLLLPYLRMNEEDACPFLRDGICSIHAARPGICRLFPLGRDYDADTRTFRYFLLPDACPKRRENERIGDWIGLPRMEEYEAFVADWHYLVKDLQAYLAKEPSLAEALSSFVLKVFYLTPFAGSGCADPDEAFYRSYRIRAEQARSVIS